MSFAPRDSHEAQVQFALERGVPAVIGVLGTIKLPYPARAFDMAHCSRCLIPWGANSESLSLSCKYCYHWFSYGQMYPCILVVLI
jgi:Putative S-adenosyl-L-methionine-dependent methyltransferase